jgi:hypothetical protein
MLQDQLRRLGRSLRFKLRVRVCVENGEHFAGFIAHEALESSVLPVKKRIVLAGKNLDRFFTSPSLAKLSRLS